MTREVKPPGEPTERDGRRGRRDCCAASGADAVVAIGGGSVIDTAKAARLCAQLELPYPALAGSYPPPTVALVALPTTAGTGSEVSGGAVISDAQSGRKAGIANANLRAQHALVDPLLTHSMPPAMTANTGVDALAQAIAGMVAKCATPIGDAIALEAIRMIARSLVAAHADGTDAGARAEMACGSLMAGLTMNISDCTAEHSLGQAIGGEFHVPHGLTIGLVLAETLERERHVVPEVLERVADALGEPPTARRTGRGPSPPSRTCSPAWTSPCCRLGVTEGDLDDLADLAIEDFFISIAPKPWTQDDVVRCYREALAITAR